MSDSNQPPAARDAQGRQWHPKITCGTLMRFETHTGRKFFDPQTLQNLEKSLSVGDLIALAFFSCREESRARNVALDDFADSFTSDIQMLSIAEAIGPAIALFFQSQQKSNPVPVPAPGNGSGN